MLPPTAACVSEFALVPGVLVASVVNIALGLEYENVVPSVHWLILTSALKLMFRFFIIKETQMGLKK